MYSVHHVPCKTAAGIFYYTNWHKQPFISDEQKNEMQKLEEKARQLAEEAVRDQPKPDKGILFVR